MAEKRLNLNGKTITYDTCKATEVYAAIQNFFPGTAKDWTAEMVFPFLATGADAARWLVTLRNVEYRLNNPKPKSRSRRSPGKAPKGHNPAELITKQTSTDSLF